MGNILNKEGLEHLAEVLDEKYGNPPIPQALVKTTYAELKALRDGGKLVAGTWYRITDYECTTIQENTRSAGHRFDVIVLALDNKTLSEEARACKHDGYTYFKDCKLEAWKVWYCLDNDETRFAWASKEQITAINVGAVHAVYQGNTIRYEGRNYYVYEGEYMNLYSEYTIDQLSLMPYQEQGENIFYSTDGDESLSLLSLVDDGSWYEGNDYVSLGGHGVIYRMIDEWNNDVPYDFKNIQFLRQLAEDGSFAEGGNDVYLFTFNWYDENGECVDTSIFGNNGSLLNDEGLVSGVYGNIVKPFYDMYRQELDVKNTCQRLNDIVFHSWYEYEGGLYYGCCFNTFGNYCYSNTFGNNCYYNTFGNYCCFNTFGNYCYSNTFGNECLSNTFGNYCYSNTFGNNCYSNTFGDSCDSNTFGDNCRSNTFGDNCSFNTFGSNCQYNTFGDKCRSNTFGSDCQYNTLGTSSSAKNYMQYITLENGVSYTYINCSATTSSSKNGQNIHVNSGVVGASKTNRKTLTISTAGNTFLTTFGSANDTTINV